MIRILLVEKKNTESQRITAAMRELHYETVCADSCEEALERLSRTGVQLILASSASDGTELTHMLRESGDTVPVLILTEDESRAEKRRIFRSGADGYMLRPVDTEELQMRVKNLLWRCRIVDDAVLRFGSCTLIAQDLTLETPKGIYELRRMEFLLLEKLLSYPGRIFTRSQLMDELWGYDSESDPRTVDTHIRRLRKKLRDVDEIRLLTVRGLGYRAAMPRRVRKNLEKLSTEQND